MYEILCFSETWITKEHNIDQFVPSIFVSYCANRNNENSDYGRGGGVAIFINKKLKSIRMNNYENDQIECVCVKISVSGRSFIVFLAYVPPYSNVDVFDKHVTCIQNILSNEKCPIIVVGDFNLSKVRWERSNDGEFYIPFDIPTGKRDIYGRFIDKMMLLSLYQVCNIQNVHNNVLDLVYSCDFKKIFISSPRIAITEIDRIDKAHPPLEIIIDCSKDRPNEPTVKEVFLFRRGNYERMNRQMEAINYQHEFNTRSIDGAFDFLCNVIRRAIVDNVPKRHIRCNNNPKWWNREMLHLKNKRNKAWKKRGENEDAYYEALREFNEMNNKLFDEYLTSVQGKIVSDPKYFWSYVKERNKNTVIPAVMTYDNCIAESRNDIVNFFANSFEKMFDRDEVDYDVQAMVANCLHESFEVRVALRDIEYAIRQIKSNGSKGPDDIHPMVVRRCSDVLVWPIWLLFGKTFESGNIPTAAKESRIVPIHKKGDRSKIENYRMVAIGSVILRIMEKAVFYGVNSFVESRLANEQHGFRHNRSISTNLLNLSIAANEAFARRNQLDIFYGDFQTAFDRVCHRILIGKLIEFGMGARTIEWISSFLSNRRNYVEIEGVKSRQFNSWSGVGAGTTLGPLLFLVFINDIRSYIEYSDFLLFADDIKVYAEIRSQGDTRKLQMDIDNVFKWCQDNRLYFNINKCNVITLCRNNTSVMNDYVLDGQIVTRVDEIRDLGVTVDSRFRFVTHVEKIISAARQTIGFIKRISSDRFEKSVLRLLYVAYVRSKLEFGSVIWDPYQQVYRDDLESVQKSFIVFLLGDEHRAPPYRLAPYHDRCKLLGLPSLASRRIVAKLMLGYDIMKQRVNDPNICRRFAPYRPTRQLRSTRILVEESYAADYLFFQPTAVIVRLMNMYSDLYLLSGSKEGFRDAVRSILYFKDEDDD